VVVASSDTTLCLLGEKATPATPRTKPPPASVPVPMNARRVHLRMFASSTVSDRVDGTSHPDECATAADVRNRRVDVFVGRARNLFKQRSDGDDHPRLAVPALRYRLIEPRLLDGIESTVSREALDRRDVRTVNLRYRKHARTDRAVVDQHRACAAGRDPAAELRAGHAKRVAERPQERRVRFDVERMS